MTDIRVIALPGDGVGPEVTAAGRLVLEAVCARGGHALTWKEHDVGYASWTRRGTPLTQEALEACREGPAVFLGAVGDRRGDGLPPDERPEAALLRLRTELGCFANLRPAKLDAALRDASALRPEIGASCDFVVVRELTGGIYYGTPRGHDVDAGRAVNTLVYTDAEVERIARVAFELARRRRGHVTSVDKANVLEVSRLWRAAVTRVAADYGDVTLEHMLVDRAAMEIVLAPRRFDVLLTENMFGDILSDEAAAICGSLGVLPSASVGGAVALYEPVHGSAPDIAGAGVANPVGAIRSMAMMLDHSFGLAEEAAIMEGAVSHVLEAGLRTKDLTPNGEGHVSTIEFATAVAAACA